MTTQLIVNPEILKQFKGSFYDSCYSNISQEFVISRDYGALAKCQSIIQLTNGQSIGKVLEVGAGLGSIIKRLQQLNFAPEYYAVEISPNAANFLCNQNIPNLKAVYIEDVTKSRFEDNIFDLAILSHVLEHVPNPELFLKEVLRITKEVVVEVPLEDSLTENLYALYRRVRTGSRRENNELGHINFFNKKTLWRIVKEANGQILKQLNYRPRTATPTFRDKTFFCLYKVFGPKVIGSHHALLITKEKI
jgi:SAM-dependent methyltransferase